MELFSGSSFWLTRYCIQRSLGFIYLMGFLIALNQGRALIGEKGLLPAQNFIRRVSFWDSPSLFHFHFSDTALFTVSVIGLLLSLLAITGFSDRYGISFSVVVWGLLWVLYLSIVNVGQTFYGFGWETLLLEAGFLAIFLGSSDTAPPVIVIWLMRWCLFRVMFGAGLIKMRADECWHNLTCLFYHYETQPLPNPISWYMHQFPKFIHKGGVLFNHFVELIVPFGFFIGGNICAIAGLFTIIFQVILIISGNLSWLNYVTIVLTFSCFNDAWLGKIIPVSFPASEIMHLPRKIVLGILTLFIAMLSLRPTLNLFGRRQLMNASFEPFHIVNTYGAFGSVTKIRREVILEGTADSVITDHSEWKEYEFKGKPGNVYRRPPFVSPYHWKLDWQMWFAAMSPYWQHPWILNLIAKLLKNDPKTIKLISKNPFPDTPPKYIRAKWYEYHFTKAPIKKGPWWIRRPIGNYLPALSLEDPKFKSILEEQFWN